MSGGLRDGRAPAAAAAAAAAASSAGAAPCGVCALHARVGGPPLAAWTDGLWLVRHHQHPAPLAGWFLLDSVRCVRNAADFSDTEAAEFGAVLRRVTRAVREACGVPRTYTIMFGEGAPHLHAHIIPREPSDPASCAWSVADLYRDVERGVRAAATPDAVEAVVARVRSLLSGARA